MEAQIEAASAYEALFVPALFGQFAPKVAEAARIRSGQRVLDVACGTGVLARELVARVGRGGRVVGVDRNPGMVAVARRITPAAEWHEGVAESLPFGDASFDAVACQFGLMFFSDRPQALREMMRVLRPGGRLVVAVWDLLDNIPAYESLAALVERTVGRAAADALRAPFLLGDRRPLGALFAQAGIASAAIATHAGTARFPSIRVLVEADVTGWLPVMGVTLTDEQAASILQEAETVLAAYRTADGQASFPLSSHVVTAQKD